MTCVFTEITDTLNTEQLDTTETKGSVQKGTLLSYYLMKGKKLEALARVTPHVARQPHPSRPQAYTLLVRGAIGLGCSDSGSVELYAA